MSIVDIHNFSYFYKLSVSELPHIQYFQSNIHKPQSSLEATV